jgi:hypothetical protein
MQLCWHDVRFAIRGLLRKPGSAVLAVLMLGLGIGANTAIFSMVNALLLRPLDLREPENIVSIWESRSDNDKFPISIPDTVTEQCSYADGRDGQLECKSERREHTGACSGNSGIRKFL